jgi:WD40 repeat protein
LESGKALPILTPSQKHDTIHSLAFSPDGKFIAAGIFNQVSMRGDNLTPQPVRIWDLERNELASDLSGHGRATMCIAYTRDGTRLASAGWDERVRLWDPATGKQIWEFKTGERGTFHSVAISPYGKLIACAGYLDKFFICDLETGRELRRIPCPQSTHRVAFSPNGTLLATSSMDTSVLIWDARPWMAGR